ncbi:hypothetical protein [Paenibacillus cymbidii]|uniref:hypothetical protein n=1 Tax=Paenibacillus cymbidii TaxID=1639034 RepID=UPI0010800C4F|nr:hypothetical protein [Paenibacillus cymbidii]
MVVPIYWKAEIGLISSAVRRDAFSACFMRCSCFADPPRRVLRMFHALQLLATRSKAEISLISSAAHRNATLRLKSALFHPPLTKTPL